MIKRGILIVLLAIGTIFGASASHLMGGEITWACQGGGMYVFTMKLYRDCNGITTSSLVNLNVTNHPTITSIPLSLVSQRDISPTCNASGPAISCSAAESEPGWPTSPTTIAGAVQESVFQSAPIALPGTPPAAGWIFTYSDCCRNPSITNLLNPVSHGFTLRAIMYAYLGMNESPCFDSSPEFLESPSTIICTGYPFTYNHNAYDPDLDSLYYSWAQPLEEYSGTFDPSVPNPPPFPFAAGYSYNSPLPGTTQNAANVPATINPATGEISFTSFTQGNFVTVVKVESWKCGQKVAEIYREMQIVLLPCAANNPPAVTFSTYSDTVVAGTLVNFTLNAADPGFLADGVTPQSLTLTASGNQFGAGYTSSTTGCSNPPCATLSSAPPITATTNVSTQFTWQTDCSHLASNSTCNTHSNTYTFVFKTKDDFCPAPAENISTVSITVLPQPVVASPFLHCVSVLPSGDVVLNWTPPADTGGTFNSYQIYSAASLAGPYTLIDSVFSLATSSYTHIGANAAAAPVYYFIQTRSGCGGMVMSAAVDTLRSMYLSVVNPANGTALLNWNTLSSPLPAGASGVYQVYEEYPSGVWTLVGTTTNTTFVDTILVCNANIRFRVEMSDASGCTSVSSMDGGIFQNIIVPAIPELDTLSVDDANTALMNWNPSSSPDVEAYVIYRFDGSVWVPVDTVYGINSTNYNYLLSTAGASSEEYRLAAFDSCGNISPLGAIGSTIFLKATAAICDRSADLSWNAYTTFSSGVANYSVYVSTVSQTGPYTFLGSVSSSVLNYTASGLLPNTQYYFKVTATELSGTKTVSSNRIAFYSATPVPPMFSYLRKVTVLDPNQVDISCHVDVAASTLKYKFMRSFDPSGPWVLAGVKPSTATTPVLFSDSNVKTDLYSYYYKVINVDSCGFDGMETNLGRTILLKANSNSQDMVNYLSWNDYEDWQGSVLSYNIYRGIDGVFDPAPIANVPYSGTGTNFYTDDVSMLLQGQGQFDYYIEALEGMGNTYGFSENSLSNHAEAYQDPKVFIPNAFKPLGLNSVFIPVTTYVDFTEYDFMVFNRWGLKVFETTDVNQGWDGTSHGQKCEFGVYVYLLKYKTSKGEYMEQKGTVTLLR